MSVRVLPAAKALLPAQAMRPSPRTASGVDTVLMPRVALSMIVRNEAATLRRCLESVRGVVDEMVIADTGSTDDTPAIARDYGARVVEVPWDNDFAAARNRALAGMRERLGAEPGRRRGARPRRAAAIAALTAAARTWPATRSPSATTC